MKFKDARVSIFIDRDETTIELYDYTAKMSIAQIVLNPEQLSTALSRMALTDCKAYFWNTDKINKKMIHKYWTFEIPKDIWMKENSKRLTKLMLEKCPKGWTPDLYTGAYDSFSSNDGKYYCKTIIRKWVRITKKRKKRVKRNGKYK